jgi:hypothetical protein
MPEDNTRDELETRMAEQTAELRRSGEQEIEVRQILDLVPQLIAVYGPNRKCLYDQPRLPRSDLPPSRGYLA